MKNVFLMLFVMMGLGLGTNLQAQTTCTPEQMAACKKICDPSKCTAEQIAACKKICSAKSSVASTEAETAKTAKAVKVVNQSPAKKASCNAASTAKAGNQAPLSPVRLIGLDELEKPKTSCQKPCEAKEAKKVKEG